MEEMTPKLTVLDVLGYLSAYACWTLVAAISMLTILQMRMTLNVVWAALGGSRWVLRPVDRFGLVLLGLIWLVYVIFVEQHYRSSITTVRKKRLRARMQRSAPASDTPKNKVMQVLQRLGLDILVRRLVPTLIAPFALLVLAFLIQRLSFWLLGT